MSRSNGVMNSVLGVNCYSISSRSCADYSLFKAVFFCTLASRILRIKLHLRRESPTVYFSQVGFISQHWFLISLSFFYSIDTL